MGYYLENMSEEKGWADVLAPITASFAPVAASMIGPKGSSGQSASSQSPIIIMSPQQQPIAQPITYRQPPQQKSAFPIPTWAIITGGVGLVGLTLFLVLRRKK